MELSCIAEGGSGNYQYEWHKVDGGIVDVTNETLTDSITEEGEYYCVVSDGFDSVTSKTVRVSDNEPLSVTCLQENNYLIPGQEPPIIRMQITGGIWPYTIEWATGEPGNAQIIETYETSRLIAGSRSSENIVSHKTEAPGIYWCMVTDSTGDWQFDVSYVVERSSEKLAIIMQPLDTEIYVNPSHLDIKMAQGTGWMEYSLYKDGELYDVYRNESDNPLRLYQNVTVYEPGEYYFHVEDSEGRWTDSDKATVTKILETDEKQVSKKERLRIVQQPEGGTISTRTGNFTLCVRVAHGEGKIEYALYKDGEEYTVTERAANAVDRQFCEVKVDKPGKYHFEIRDDSTGTGFMKSNSVIVRGTDEFYISTIKVNGN
ncbi:MAG: hypothetical protein IKE43_07830, partial [Coriobacteriales bacterium]|nr:hypothetical protein [Coriobacteriales bacterium]